jgi:hypothetical protein
MKPRLTPALLLFNVLRSISFPAELVGPSTYPLPAVLENQEKLILNIDLAASQACAPHRHSPSVAYVLEGTVEMQVRGASLTPLGPVRCFIKHLRIFIICHTMLVTPNRLSFEPISKAVGSAVSGPVEQLLTRVCLQYCLF